MINPLSAFQVLGSEFLVERCSTTARIWHVISPEHYIIQQEEETVFASNCEPNLTRRFSTLGPRAR
jgi:hypothetical protein